MITPVTEEELVHLRTSGVLDIDTDVLSRAIDELRDLRKVADAAFRQYSNCGCCCQECCNVEDALRDAGRLP